MSYLFCEKCGGYYELQKGENPDDFLGCECGGKLTYSLRLDSLKDPENYKNLGKYNKESIESYRKLKRTIKNYKKEKNRKFWFNRNNLSLKALLVGFLIGLIPVPFITSIVGGLFVGFIAGGSYKRGALHGFVAGTISLSTPIFILSNPLGSGFDLLIGLITVSIIVSIIPEIIFSLMGTAIRKKYDNRSKEIDLNKYPYEPRVKWWNNIGSKGQAIVVIAVYFVILAFIAQAVNFNDFNLFQGNVSNSLQSTSSIPSDVDDGLKVEALSLVENNGYWSTYHKELKNGMVKNTYYINGMYFGKVEIDRDSVKILSSNKDSMVLQYKAVHHSLSRDSDPDLYFDLVYLYTEKAVKSNGEWKLAETEKEPQFIKEESYKRWYSPSTNLWYREKIN